MTGLTFEYNWLAENTCTGKRAQILTLNDFAGTLEISTISIHDQTGINNYYTSASAHYNWNFNPITGMYRFMSMTPLFTFTSTVDLNEALF